MALAGCGIIFPSLSANRYVSFMRIQMVKKLKIDGSACKKCADVEKRLSDAGLLDSIDEIVIADESDPDSKGMVLARELDVENAPFFIVEDPPGIRKVYTIYFKFLKEVLQHGENRKQSA